MIIDISSWDFFFGWIAGVLTSVITFIIVYFVTGWKK